MDELRVNRPKRKCKGHNLTFGNYLPHPCPRAAVNINLGAAVESWVTHALQKASPGPMFEGRDIVASGHHGLWLCLVTPGPGLLWRNFCLNIVGEVGPCLSYTLSAQFY